MPNRDAALTHLSRLARNAQVHSLVAFANRPEVQLENVVVTELGVTGPYPEMSRDGRDVEGFEREDAFDQWQKMALRVMELWV